jgi:hypothetical protein
VVDQKNTDETEGGSGEVEGGRCQEDTEMRRGVVKGDSREITQPRVLLRCTVRDQRAAPACSRGLDQSEPGPRDGSNSLL